MCMSGIKCYSIDVQNETTDMCRLSRNSCTTKITRTSGEIEREREGGRDFFEPGMAKTFVEYR